MKLTTFLGLAPLFSLFLPSSTLPSAPAKRALLIGVHDYSATGGKWDNLQSDRDVAMVRAGLKAYFGFQDSEIKTLSSAQETNRKSILDSIDALVGESKPGDVIYIHYSGHGYQTEDENGDETDFLDEVLVPSDGTSAKAYILDDEINARLDQLRKKGITNVTLSFDCCNSGSNTRGIEKTRGRSYPAFGEAKVAGGTRGKPQSGGTLLSGGAEGYVVLQATAPNEEARETEDGGRLTVAMVEAWRVAATRGTKLTYRELFERTSESIARMYKINPQRPQIEGDVDRFLFDSTMARPQPYFPIRVDDEAVFVQAGEVHGITVGSRLSLYAAGTTDFAKAEPLAQAIVMQVEIDRAKLALPDDFNPEHAVSARAVVTEYGQNNGSLRLYVDSQAGGIRAALAEVLSIDMQSATASSYDIKLTRSADNFVIEQADGAVLAQVPANGREQEGIKTALRNLVRWSLVRRLQNPSDSHFSAEIKVVRVQTEPDPTNPQMARFKSVLSGQGTTFKKGEHFAIQVKVDGDLNPFIAVLDLLPDGTVASLWPVQARDMKIPTTGEWYWLSPSRGFLKVGTEEAGAKIDIYEVDPESGGAGQEAFKLMVTKEFVDFGGLVSGDPNAARGAKSPLEHLLSAYGTGTRAKSISAPPKDWATASATITVSK